jgi:uncharacterized protein (TIGR02391 family)
MPKLIDIVPSIDQLLALASPQLGHALLQVLLPGQPDQVLKELVSSSGRRINLHPQNIEIGGYAPRAREAELKLLEAWSWLEAESLIIRTDVNQGSFGFSTLSLKGAQFLKNADFRVLRASRRVSRDDLHELLHADPLQLFWQGSYDTSVFAAFKAIEVYVRAASGLAPNDLGVDLVRKAFAPNKGALADHSLPAAEQEAVSHLFAGAIGLFKNPTSHRYVAYDADTCADVLIMASRLLRMVDMRVAVP